MCSCSAAQKPRLRTHWRKLKEERLPANLALDQPNCTARARNPRKLKPRVLQNLQRSRVSSSKRQAGISERKPSAAKRTSKKRGQRRQRWHHGIIVLISGSEKDGLDEKDAA
jgi:hypothetical protein